MSRSGLTRMTQRPLPIVVMHGMGRRRLSEQLQISMKQFDWDSNKRMHSDNAENYGLARAMTTAQSLTTTRRFGLNPEQPSCSLIGHWCGKTREISIVQSLT